MLYVIYGYGYDIILLNCSVHKEKFLKLRPNVMHMCKYIYFIIIIIIILLLFIYIYFCQAF